ncbi:MAG: hypothetical protein SGI90_04375 [Candidatus Eisenbacteria bacterium]|nr:hypothetical protein [Candidatus Eisenbacteria bacterium]
MKSLLDSTGLLGVDGKHVEGEVARKIEDQTAKLPSDLFLWAALGALGISLILHQTRKEESALFVGQLAAPLLLMGVYNKIVKVAGSDKVHG